MNSIRVTMIVFSIIIAGYLSATELLAQTSGGNGAKKNTEITKPDISGEWLSSSPLDRFVQDESPQPVNTFRIERAKDGGFKARYLGSRATSIALSWVEETKQYEGTKESREGVATFVVTPTEDPDVLICEIEAEYNLNSDAFYHKDKWTRASKKSSPQGNVVKRDNNMTSPKFIDAPEFIVIEADDGLVAVKKGSGESTKIEIGKPEDGTTRLSRLHEIDGYAFLRINGDLICYSNYVSRWTKLPNIDVPGEHQHPLQLSIASNGAVATVGAKSFFLSRNVTEWELTPTIVLRKERIEQNNPSKGISKTIPSTSRDGIRNDKDSSEVEAWNAARNYSITLQTNGAIHPSAVAAKQKLAQTLSVAFDRKLKEEQRQITELKERIRDLESKVAQRVENRSAVIETRMNELIALSEKAAKDNGQVVTKKESPAEPESKMVLLYDDQEELTSDMKSELESLIGPYMEQLKTMGFKLNRGQATLRVQPGMGNAHYYHNIRSIVTDPKYVSDASCMRREYNHHALAVALGENAQEIFQKCSGIESGLADYFGCSSCDDPNVGFGRGMVNQRWFSEVNHSSERHDLGDVLAGALWEMRDALGADVLDPLLYKAWADIMKSDESGGQIVRFGVSLLTAAQNEKPEYAEKIREIFKERKLDLP